MRVACAQRWAERERPRAAQDIPVVACGRPLGHERDISYVAADDRDGARQMVRYLHARGYRRIGTITGPQDTPGGVDRLAGYLVL